MGTRPPYDTLYRYIAKIREGERKIPLCDSSEARFGKQNSLKHVEKDDIEMVGNIRFVQTMEAFLVSVPHKMVVPAEPVFITIWSHIQR